MTTKTKWKYATIPAETRLEMLKSGDSKLYDEELARTREAIKNRLDVGLDVTEQMNWADKVAYNFNLSRAEKNGIAPESISADGYAEAIFADLTSEPKENSRESTAVDGYIKGINKGLNALTSSYDSRTSQIRSEYEKSKNELIRAFQADEKNRREQLINSGYSENGEMSMTERLKRMELLIKGLTELEGKKDSQLSSVKADYDSQLAKLYQQANTGIADEKYRYQQLSNQEKRELYERFRDAVSDEQWKTAHELEKTIAEKNQQLDEKKQADSQRLEEENRLSKATLAKAENDLKKQQLDDERAYKNALLELERLELLQKNENDKSDEDTNTSDDSDKATKQNTITFGAFYENYKELAVNVANSGSSHKKRELMSWIDSFPLTYEEKRQIKKEAGLLR